ncbi:hypothetical protein [Halobiforma nitratireducens]|uniref:DUF2064 domain-containing protein n=1 Tax=Halobiforma nitratireducens JCM 10879 TaxID=1227454 RepID=M0MGF9_9EURY|nr:hypothetical protein [Halobiforma nitratireducens]EMA44428.1 hypothetical protein C446_03022 [Halobiforma nitratireducens JCM 10879]
MIVVVPVDPPREGLVLSELVERTPLTDADAAVLYEAAVTDVVRTVADSGGELLVNYRDAETLPATDTGGDAPDPETEIRDLVAAALEDAPRDIEDVRFERQVGSTRSARIGNSVTHLLESEDVASVGVVEPTAPAVERSQIDGAAMGLRRHEAVFGPSSGGRTYLSAFREPIDFEDAYAPPSHATLATRATDAGLEFGFAPMIPTIATPDGLAATLATLETRALADRLLSTATPAVLEELGVRVTDDGLEFEGEGEGKGKGKTGSESGSKSEDHRDHGEK